MHLKLLTLVLPPAVPMSYELSAGPPPCRASLRDLPEEILQLQLGGIIIPQKRIYYPHVIDEGIEAPVNPT